MRVRVADFSADFYACELCGEETWSGRHWTGEYSRFGNKLWDSKKECPVAEEIQQGNKTYELANEHTSVN